MCLDSVGREVVSSGVRRIVSAWLELFVLFGVAYDAIPARFALSLCASNLLSALAALMLAIECRAPWGEEGWAGGFWNEKGRGGSLAEAGDRRLQLYIARKRVATARRSASVISLARRCARVQPWVQSPIA